MFPSTAISPSAWDKHGCASGLSGRFHHRDPVESITIKVGDEKVDLWVPPPVPGVSHYTEADVRPFLIGPDWACEGIDTWEDPEPHKMFYDLSRECGILWGCEEGTKAQHALRDMNDLIVETDRKIKMGVA